MPGICACSSASMVVTLMDVLGKHCTRPSGVCLFNIEVYLSGINSWWGFPAEYTLSFLLAGKTYVTQPIRIIYFLPIGKMQNIQKAAWPNVNSMELVFQESTLNRETIPLCSSTQLDELGLRTDRPCLTVLTNCRLQSESRDLQKKTRRWNNGDLSKITKHYGMDDCLARTNRRSD
jgi:hypothetical protein